jgi:hypothetical protein
MVSKRDLKAIIMFDQPCTTNTLVFLVNDQLAIS